MKTKSKLAAVVTAFLVLSLAQPATATTLTLSIPNKAVGEVNELRDGTTQALAFVVSVPHQNQVIASNSIGFALSDLAVGEAVTVSATNARLVTKLHTSGAPVGALDGANLLNLKSLGGNPVSFFAYTTSSSAGSVSLTHSGATSVYHLIGATGPAYNLTLESPSFVDSKGSAVVSATVKDAFGNHLDGSSGFTPATGFNLVVIGGNASSFSYSQSTKSYQTNLTPRAGQGVLMFSVEIDATTVTGLGEANPSESRTITVEDFESAMALIQAQLVTLKVLEKAARKAHNQLARKWNRLGGTKVKVLKKPLSSG